jgi:hypothetical protein
LQNAKKCNDRTWKAQIFKYSNHIEIICQYFYMQR